MAILYGTQSNGETLPVLVDQFGNLLAKGIEGQPGIPGTPGKPGPPGGSFPLPPDPYEGAFLGWLNNELAWIGTPPVPIPDGVFGPITDWDPAGLLTVQGDIPSQVKQGVFIYQCNEDGTIFVEGWNNSQAWSDGGGHITGGSWLNVFDADVPAGLDTNNGAYLASNDTTPSILTFSVGISGVLKVWATTDYTTGSTFITLNTGERVEITGGTNSPAWYSFGAVTNVTSMTLGSPSSTDGLVLGAMEINGRVLADQGEYPTAPNLNFRVQSVSGQNLIGVANRTENFSIGKYLRVPEQNVARWLYDGNLNKVITSTGIDISRLKET